MEQCQLAAPFLASLMPILSFLAVCRLQSGPAPASTGQEVLSAIFQPDHLCTAVCRDICISVLPANMVLGAHCWHSTLRTSLPLPPDNQTDLVSSRVTSDVWDTQLAAIVGCRTEVQAYLTMCSCRLRWPIRSTVVYATDRVGPNL